MPKLIEIRTQVVRQSMRMAFTTALGSKTVATSVLVRAILDDGSAGLGEVPTSFVMPHETVEVIRHTIRQAGNILRGQDIYTALIRVPALRGAFAPCLMTISGLEVALLRAMLASQGKTEFVRWGGHRERIQTDITIFFTPQDEPLQRWIDQAIDTGFTTFKVKTSGKVKQDVEFLWQVRDKIARRLERFTLRLDGNQGYTAASLEKMFSRLDRLRLAYELFEQPLRKDDIEGLMRITAIAPVPIILDETIFDSRDVRFAIENGLGHGVNIKIAKSGFIESEAILKLARQAKWKTMIGCMSETMVGLSAGILFAAGRGSFKYVDLDSIHFFPHLPRYGPIEIAGPEYVIR